MVEVKVREIRGVRELSHRCFENGVGCMRRNVGSL